LREAAETSVTASCRVTSSVRPPPASMEAAHGDGPAWLAEQPRRGDLGCVLGLPWRSGLLNLAGVRTRAPANRRRRGCWALGDRRRRLCGVDGRGRNAEDRVWWVRGWFRSGRDQRRPLIFIGRLRTFRVWQRASTGNMQASVHLGTCLRLMRRVVLHVA
jgi:hypothetical protein